MILSMTGSMVNREELQKWEWRLGISSIEYNKSIETLAVGDSYVTNGQPWVQSLNDGEREREKEMENSYREWDDKYVVCQ